MKDGLLIINKPEGITSHDVVAKVRKKLQTKKVGHTGTLDPMATGVLVICVGAATKLVQYLTCEDKIYDVEMQLGIKTDTGDITGRVVETQNEKQVIFDSSILYKFVGKQKQIPPMYSAIKKDGIKLYELARKGIEVEREARDIEIFDISNVEYSENIIKYRVHCSKGTYVRVLCEKIAETLGTIGTMTKLNRVKTGQFSIEDACEVDDVCDEKIVPMEDVFVQSINIGDEINKLINGMSIEKNVQDGLYNLYHDSKYIGLGEVKNKKLKRKIII